MISALDRKKGKVDAGSWVVRVDSAPFEEISAEIEVVLRSSDKSISADYLSRVESVIEIGSKRGTSYADALRRTVRPWVELVIRESRNVEEKKVRSLRQPGWLRAVLKASASQGMQEAFSALYDEIELRLKSDDYGALSELLRALTRNADKIDPVLVVSGLRLTWLARESILGWREALDEVGQALKANGHDHQSILAGLYD